MFFCICSVLQVSWVLSLIPVLSPGDLALFALSPLFAIGVYGLTEVADVCLRTATLLGPPGFRGEALPLRDTYLSILTGLRVRPDTANLAGLLSPGFCGRS